MLFEYVAVGARQESSTMRARGLCRKLQNMRRDCAPARLGSGRARLYSCLLKLLRARVRSFARSVGRAGPTLIPPPVGSTTKLEFGLNRTAGTSSLEVTSLDDLEHSGRMC